MRARYCRIRRDAGCDPGIGGGHDSSGGHNANNVFLGCESVSNCGREGRSKGRTLLEGCRETAALESGHNKTVVPSRDSNPHTPVHGPEPCARQFRHDGTKTDAFFLRLPSRRNINNILQSRLFKLQTAMEDSTKLADVWPTFVLAHDLSNSLDLSCKPRIFANRTV